MLNTLGKNFSRQHFEIFSYFPQKTGFYISCRLSPICMKCLILFSGKNKKNITNLSSAELAQKVVKVRSDVKIHKVHFFWRNKKNITRIIPLIWSYGHAFLRICKNFCMPQLQVWFLQSCSCLTFFPEFLKCTFPSLNWDMSTSAKRGFSLNFFGERMCTILVNRLED